MTQSTEEWSANIYAVITVGKWHVTVAVSEVWSYVLFLQTILPDVQQCPWSWFCSCHHVSDRSLAVRSSFLWFMSVSKGEMINMWLQVGSSEASDNWGWHFMDLSRICLFEVFAEHSPAWFPDKWKDPFKDTLVLEQALQTADCSILQSFVSTTGRTNWINLSPIKVGVVLFSLISPAC